MYTLDSTGGDMLVDNSPALHHVAYAHATGHHGVDLLSHLGNDLEFISFDSPLLDALTSYASPPAAPQPSHLRRTAGSPFEHSIYSPKQTTSLATIQSPPHSSSANLFASSGPSAPASTDEFSELYYDYLFSAEQPSTDSEADPFARHVASPSSASSPTPTEPAKGPWSANIQHNKPAFSYRSLVGAVLQMAGSNGLTLKEMYAAIEDKYPYFRTASAQGQGASWRSSVRHNLVSHPEFARVNLDAEDAAAGLQPKRSRKCAATAAADPTVSPRPSDTDGLRFVNNGRRTRWALVGTAGDSRPGTITITTDAGESSARLVPAAATTTDGTKPPRSHRKKQQANSLTAEAVNHNNNMPAMVDAPYYLSHSHSYNSSTSYESVKYELTPSLVRSASTPMLPQSGIMRTRTRQLGSTPTKTARRSSSPLTSSPYSQTNSPMRRSSSAAPLQPSLFNGGHHSQRSVPCDVPGRRTHTAALPPLHEYLMPVNSPLPQQTDMRRGSSVPANYSIDSWQYATAAKHPSRGSSFSAGPQLSNSSISSPSVSLVAMSPYQQLGYAAAAHIMSPRARHDSLSSVEEHFERSLNMADLGLYTHMLQETAAPVAPRCTTTEILDLAVWLSG